MYPLLNIVLSIQPLSLHLTYIRGGNNSFLGSIFLLNMRKRWQLKPVHRARQLHRNLGLVIACCMNAFFLCAKFLDHVASRNVQEDWSFIQFPIWPAGYLCSLLILIT